MFVNVATGQRCSFREFVERVRDGATALGADVSQGSPSLHPENGDLVGTQSENFPDYVALLHSLLIITVPFALFSSYSTLYEFKHANSLAQATRILPVLVTATRFDFGSPSRSDLHIPVEQVSLTPPANHQYGTPLMGCNFFKPSMIVVLPKWDINVFFDSVPNTSGAHIKLEYNCKRQRVPLTPSSPTRFALLSQTYQELLKPIPGMLDGRAKNKPGSTGILVPGVEARVVRPYANAFHFADWQVTYQSVMLKRSGPYRVRIIG
ncbi:uncharacterized protein BJ212DRAFT_1590975 [Suillus subaureus]|uniref:Uncharacterized protein n=1 Tax=Suillus subaureus TaxID=48587 RepID=A0A9P7J633_9AGAM|nr:uncharacterized protein BJ212DRAFT_1590975 [Suillus subaureus]KAG1804527.1 hypothetical protein BJ212DRAFT_1590975 [Suillus subaureus]